MADGLLFTLPIYEGNIKPAFMQSLMVLQNSLIHGGLPHDFMFLTNESLVTRARNNCVARFLECEYSHMMFIDSDIGFSADDVAKLWGHAFEGHDLVVGSAQRVAERMGDEFAGFVIVGWNGNGAYRQVAYLNTALHIAPDLIPDMVKKAVEGSYG